jgi:GR25 family glycosyltransferase involved in LPS biosynthesis
MIPIYLINLPRRTDRLQQSTEVLKQYELDFTVFPATECADGKEGIMRTMIALFSEVKDEHVLVLEDDIELLHDPRGTLASAWTEIPKDFDMLLLGGNIYKPMHHYSDHLYKLTAAVGNHAVIYSRKVMETMKSIYEANLGGCTPTDMLLDKHIIRRGNSYITNPLLATQRPGYSDIENQEVNYDEYLINRYNKFQVPSKGDLGGRLCSLVSSPQ